MKVQEGIWNVGKGVTNLRSQTRPVPKVGLQMKAPGTLVGNCHYHLCGSTKCLGVGLGLLLFQMVTSQEELEGMEEGKDKPDPTGSSASAATSWNPPRVRMAALLRPSADWSFDQL